MPEESGRVGERESGGAGGAATGAQQGSGGGTPSQNQQPQTQATFETWYAGLEPNHRALLDGHIQGLRNALGSERQQRGDLAQQVRELTTRAGKGTDLEKQLSELQTALQAAERRSAFAEDALRPEIGCGNAKAAWALALAENMFDRHGRPDWNALKQMAPELFRKTAGSGSADGGAGNQQPARLGMNEIIRRAAGRG